MPRSRSGLTSYHRSLVYDAVILGAGAAGLFCAAGAASRGRRVALVEHAPRAGRKILISGGGRANFTNLRVKADNYLSANPHFAKSALARFTPADFLRLLDRHGIPYHEKTLGQLFCDRSAQDLLSMLEAECAAANVALLLSTAVRAVHRDTRFRIETSRGELESAALVVATGGLSLPKLGATGFGHDLARRFGLRVEPCFPALVPLTLEDADAERWSGLAGVSSEVVARLGRRAFREKMLFTHGGLSGPAILQISSYWSERARAGRREAITIDLLPGESLLETPPQEARKILERRLSARFAARWLENEGFTQPLPSVRQLDARLHGWTLTPAGTEGFAKAEVTGGGVSTAELSSQTLESRRVAGLFFIGEVVDVTGWLGGYNFHWAWASAHAASCALA